LAICKDRDDTHFYETPTGAIYPSITTVLNKTKSKESKLSLEQWRNNEPHHEYIMKQSGRIGIETHAMIERYFRGEKESEPHLFARAHFSNLLPYISNISVVYGSEIALFSDEFRVAGTADLVCLYRGMPTIIDFKTKRSSQRLEWLEDYFIQGTFYAKAFEERTGKKIPQVLILVSTESGSRQEFIVNVSDYSDKLLQRIKQYFELETPPDVSESLLKRTDLLDE